MIPTRLVRALLTVVLGLTIAVSLSSEITNATPQDKTKVYTAIPAGEYKIDPAHTTVGFEIRHLMLSVVRGRFNEFEGTIRIDDRDVTKSSVSFVAKVASVDTGVAQRDDHLRNADIFEVEKFPEMAFRSTRIERKGTGFVAHGDFTLKGVTKRIAIPFTLHGAVKDPWGGTRIGVDAATRIDRLDYGVSWNAELENGGLAVGNEVAIQLAVEAVKQ